MFNLTFPSFLVRSPKALPATPQEKPPVIQLAVSCVDEERQHLDALFDAAYDPSVLNVRRRSVIPLRSTQLSLVDFVDPEHFVKFSKIIASASTTTRAVKPVSANSLAKAVGVRDFDIIKKIGSGASGAVYLAEHKTSRRLHAIKKMEKEFLEPENAAALLNEQRALRKARGVQAVLQLEASFHDSENFFLVTAFLPGGDLRARLTEAGKLPVSMTIFYIAEAILALQILHSLGIVHRDIKPDNIFLDAYGHVVLGDLGISKQWETFPGEIRRETNPYWSALALHKADMPLGPFTTRAQCGTPTYAAPEVFQGTPYGVGVDFWSLGVTMYELLTGRTPFNDTEDFDEVCRSVREDEVTFDVKDGVDIVVQLFVLLLLQKDAVLRPGVEGMKAHPCFRGIDWAKVAARQIDAPWVPGQFDLFEEVRDAKAHGGTFQLVGGDNFSVDPFPFYTFTAPDFSMPRSPAPAVSATPALLSALSTPALSIASSASSGSGSSRLSPRLSGFFGRMRQVLTPQTSRSPVSSAESLPVPCEDATPDKPVEAEDASSVSTGPRRVSALRDECRAWLKGKLRLPKAKKGRA